MSGDALPSNRAIERLARHNRCRDGQLIPIDDGGGAALRSTAVRPHGVTEPGDHPFCLDSVLPVGPHFAKW